MAEALGEDPEPFGTLAGTRRGQLETTLYDGEYFVQRTQWEGLRAGDPVEASRGSLRGDYSAEALALLRQEGPKYQYGTGCLADGIIGAWMADMCGFEIPLDPEKVANHLRAVHRYNLKTRSLDPRQPAAPGVCSRARRGRAAMHLAQGWRAVAADGIQQ